MDGSDHDELGPISPATSRAEYFARWSQLHGGVDPQASRLINIWLSFAYSVARPMTRLGMSPNAVTVLGLVVAAGVPLLAWQGARQESGWWLLAAVLVTVLTGLLDNLDGAVAVISGRTTRWGYVLDSIADRLSDAALLAALWALGAPGPLVVAAGLLGATQEYARARAAAAGISEVGVVSISERPTRVIIVAVFLALAAWSPYGINIAGWGTIGAWAAFAVALIGAVQVFVALRKRLTLER
jgi:phosphatidylglycerophosphate synthase